MLTERQVSNTDWVQSSNHSLITERELAMYTLGKEVGAEEARKEARELYISNLERSYEDTSKVVTFLQENGLEVISARLKVHSLNSLKVMIALAYDEHLINSLDIVYNHLYDVEDKINDKEYDLTFSIIKANKGTFSDICVENDGYIFKHRLSKNAEEARPA